MLPVAMRTYIAHVPIVPPSGVCCYADSCLTSDRICVCVYVCVCVCVYTQVIAAGYASCTGLSIFLVNACRAVGIPARVTGKTHTHTHTLTAFCPWLFTSHTRLHVCGACVCVCVCACVCAGTPSWRKASSSHSLPTHTSHTPSTQHDTHTTVSAGHTASHSQGSRLLRGVDTTIQTMVAVDSERATVDSAAPDPIANGGNHDVSSALGRFRLVTHIAG